LNILKLFDVPLASGGEDRSTGSGEEDVMSAHHHLRQAPIGAAIVIVTASYSSQPMAAHGNDTTVPRVRSSDPAIIRLVEQATTRSRMFRRLVAEGEASNGIIYVEEGLCTGHLRACLPIWMSDRFVTDSAKMYFFYRRHAPTERRDRFETQEAINAGIIVGREFRAWREESASGDVKT
jgi:hypothetical protein